MKLTKTKLKQLIKEELEALKEAKDIKEGVFSNWAKSRREDKTWGSWRDAKDEEETLHLLDNSLSDIYDGYYAYAYTREDAPMDKKQKAAEVVKILKEAMAAARNLRKEAEEEEEESEDEYTKLGPHKEELHEVIGPGRVGAAVINWAKSNPVTVAGRASDVHSFRQADTKLDYLVAAGSAYNPYFAVVAAVVGGMKNAHQEWNNLPESHPLKIKHRDYIKRAKKAQKLSRQKAWSENDLGPEEAARRRARAEREANEMIKYVVGKGWTQADYAEWQRTRPKWEPGECPGCHHDGSREPKGSITRAELAKMQQDEHRKRKDLAQLLAKASAAADAAADNPSK